MRREVQRLRCPACEDATIGYWVSDTAGGWQLLSLIRRSSFQREALLIGPRTRYQIDLRLRADGLNTRSDVKVLAMSDSGTEADSFELPCRRCHYPTTLTRRQLDAGIAR